MECKLVVDLSTGHLEVSGSEDLVKYVFNEFRAEIATRGPKTQVISDPKTVSDERPQSSQGKKPSSKKATATGDVNKDLDTSGLETFFEEYQPKTDAERAIVFLKFLNSKFGSDAYASRDVYTCFFALRDRLKLPSMNSLLSNDRNRTKFFTARDGLIELSKIGENYFNQKLNKKAVT